MIFEFFSRYLVTKKGPYLHNATQDLKLDNLTEVQSI